MRLTVNQEVVGSSPTAAAIMKEQLLTMWDLDMPAPCVMTPHQPLVYTNLNHMDLRPVDFVYPICEVCEQVKSTKTTKIDGEILFVCIPCDNYVVSMDHDNSLSLRFRIVMCSLFAAIFSFPLMMVLMSK